MTAHSNDERRPPQKPRPSRPEVVLPKEVEAMVAIVERDHARANGFAESLGTTRGALFAFAGSLWTAAIGAAFATKTFLLCLLAAGVLLLIAYVDSSITAHTRAVRAQLRRLEHVLDSNYRLLLRGSTPHTRAELVNALAAVEIGQVSLLKARERRLSLQRVDPRLLGQFVKKHGRRSIKAMWSFVSGRAEGFTTRSDLQTVSIVVLALVAAGLAWVVPRPDESTPLLCVQAQDDAVVSVSGNELEAVEGTVLVVECPEEDR